MSRLFFPPFASLLSTHLLPLVSLPFHPGPNSYHLGARRGLFGCCFPRGPIQTASNSAGAGFACLGNTTEITKEKSKGDKMLHASEPFFYFPNSKSSLNMWQRIRPSFVFMGSFHKIRSFFTPLQPQCPQMSLLLCSGMSVLIKMVSLLHSYLGETAGHTAYNKRGKEAHTLQFANLCALPIRHNTITILVLTYLHSSQIDIFQALSPAIYYIIIQLKQQASI